MFYLAASPAFAQDFNLQVRSTLEYPDQTLANICGYAQNGREYALLGGSKGMIVVDVTDPDNPVNIVQIPAPEGPSNGGSLWKEIKVYQHFAYLTTEAGGGLQIINLSNLPGPNLPYHAYKGDGAIAGQLHKIHALHIDEVKGFLYAYGCSQPNDDQIFSGGALALDLNADPYNPTYAGKFDALQYIHDGFAYNDTLYASHIYSGMLSIVDMSDKSNPQLLGTVQTPGHFTHNSWLLDDHKHILTTDELQGAPSFVTSYDISDPQDIKELDRVSPNDGFNSIGHNTHVLNDWAITSWYTDGVVIADAHRPDNVVITGWYDTWPGIGQDFEGCWGVYPFLPSGTVVASNIPNINGGTGKLFVMTPNYVRACYLEGVVKNNCNGQALNTATVEVSGNNPWVDTKTSNNGVFKTGQVEPGNYTVTISKAGYFSKTINVTLNTAEVTEIDVTLEPENVVNISGQVLLEGTSVPVENAKITLVGPDDTYIVQTDVSGHFELPCVAAGDYQATASAWGYLVNTTSITNDAPVTILLKPGYYDDFETDLDWLSEATSVAGFWERGEPDGTFYQNGYSNPEQDVQIDNNDQCYVTGNSGGNAGADDVDGGSVTLSSPFMQLGVYQDAVLTFWYWFYNDGGAGDPPNDNLQVRVLSNGQAVTLLTETTSLSAWRYSGEIHLKDYITLSDDVQIQFIASDLDPGHLVEAGVDVFQVIPKAVSSTSEHGTPALFSVSPNPAASTFVIRYDWPGSAKTMLEVRNQLGQIIWTQQLSGETGSVVCGDNWPQGVYVATLRSDEKQSTPVRLVKQ